MYQICIMIINILYYLKMNYITLISLPTQPQSFSNEGRWYADVLHKTGLMN
jgi:hypothetical protein